MHARATNTHRAPRTRTSAQPTHTGRRGHARPRNERAPSRDAASGAPTTRTYGRGMRRLLLALAAFFALTTPAQAAWVWPVRGEVITPYRNGTDPYATGQHRGIDIAAPVGTPVVAAAGGDVRFAGTAGSSGLTIGIRTGDGYDTSYLHLASLAVRAGANVSTGERIGAVGTTGTRSAAEPHLHFGVRDAGTRHAYHDPLAFLPPPPAAPEPNPPAPAPAPAPEPARPWPPPTPVPTGSPVPRGSPAPRGVPFPRGAPAPRSAPAPRGVPAPRSSPVPRVAPRPHPAPAPSTFPAPVPASSAQPSPGRGPARVPRATRSPHAQAPGRPTSIRVSGGNPAPGRPGDPGNRAVNAASATPEATTPDLGWALVCGGLLLAAAILGLTGDGRRTASRTSARIAEGLRPLIGRR